MKHTTPIEVSPSNTYVPPKSSETVDHHLELRIQGVPESSETNLAKRIKHDDREIENSLTLMGESKPSVVCYVACDGVPPFHMKYSSLNTYAVFHIFSNVFSTRIWLSYWKEAYIVPIHKSGPHSNIKNYRRIKILPRTSLVLERIVFNFIY